MSNQNNSSSGSTQAANVTEPQNLAKIQPIQRTELELDRADSGLAVEERHLLNATRLLIREYGVRKSAAAIRDAVEVPYKKFGAREAVNAISNLGFKASFGKLKMTNLDVSFFPLLAFKASGEVIILKACPDENNIEYIDPEKKGKVETAAKRELLQTLSDFVILLKPLTQQEQELLKGHWFFSSFRKSKWIYVQVLIAAMISNFLGLSTALFTMTVYDRVIPNEAFESLLALSIGVVIALGFDFLIKGVRAHFIDTASKRADLEISRRLFDKLLNISPNIQNQKTGAMAGIIREFETLRDFFNSSSLVVLIDLPFVFIFIYVIALIAGPLALVPAAAVPLVFIVGLGIQPFLARITRNAMDSGMNKQAVLVETLNGLETVGATGSGKLMRKRYEEALHEQSNSGNRIRALSTFVINFASSIQQYAQVATIFFGVYLIIEGTITQGALIGAVILGGRIMSPLSQLASTLSKLNTSLSAYRSLNELFGKDAQTASAFSPISRPVLKGEIEFRNVSYTFSGAKQPVIKDLSFKVPAGQKIAVVGKMGSGKSTLSRLIAGIIEPTEGAVLIDGVDVRQIDQADLRKNVGIMLQDSWLFSGTVRENIQMGFNEYDDDHVLEICKVSCVDDFIGSHPKGYDLMIREKGAGLSGGQKQAINLARSILHNPPILLLDEPTSSMDQGTEKKVVDSLKRYGENKTMILVTHRNPILSLVDRVFVMENGRIITDEVPEKLGIKKSAV